MLGLKLNHVSKRGPRGPAMTNILCCALIQSVAQTVGRRACEIRGGPPIHITWLK